VSALARLAQADEADTALGDEPSRESLRGAEQFGGLSHGEQAVGLGWR
jgi:hypothetical protein